jgi:predicted nucleic acid-binding protein
VTRYVIDASIVLKWFLRDEADGLSSLAVLERFLTGTVDLIAPALLEFEVINGLRIAGKRGRMSNESIEAAARAFLDLDLRFVPLSFYAEKALKIAEKYDLSVYDASYLALAADSGIDLLTADEKLLKAAKDMGRNARRPVESF